MKLNRTENIASKSIIMKMIHISAVFTIVIFRLNFAAAACAAGEVLAPDGRCYERVEPAYPCHVQAQCQGGSSCRQVFHDDVYGDSVCSCPDGMIVERSVCTVGECPSHMVRVADGSCLVKVAPSYFCVVDEQCQGGSKCIEYICECPEGKKLVDQQCQRDTSGDCKMAQQARWKDTTAVMATIKVSPAPSTEEQLADICCGKCKQYYKYPNHCRLWMSVFSTSKCHLFAQHGRTYRNPYLKLNVTFGVNIDAYPSSGLPRRDKFYDGDVQLTIPNLTTPYLCMSICSARQDICRSYTWANLEHPSKPGLCELRGYSNNTRQDSLYYGGHFGKYSTKLDYGKLSDSVELYSETFAPDQFGINQQYFRLKTKEEKLNACVHFCETNFACRAFTMFIPTGLCRLHYGVGKPNYNSDSNLVAGILKTGLPESTAYAKDVALFGASYLQLIRPGPLACQLTCVQERQCRFYDYNPTTEQCNLKTDYEFAVRQTGWFSGSIAGERFETVVKLTENPLVSTPRFRLMQRQFSTFDYTRFHGSPNATNTKCALKCRESEKCRAYQTLQAAEDCYLYYGFGFDGSGVKYPNDILEPYSGVNRYAYPSSALPIDGVDLPAQILKIYPNLTNSLYCMAFCEAHFYCRAYSYSLMTGECKLKLFPNTLKAIHTMKHLQSGILGLSATTLGLDEFESYHGAAGMYVYGTHIQPINAWVTGRAPEDRMAACNRLCIANMSCRAWAVRMTDGMCYRFSKLTSTGPNVNHHIGLMKNAYPRSTYPRLNAEIIGKDHSIRGTTPNAFYCQAFCQGVDGCVAYVWYESTQKCHLKTTVEKVARKNGCHSGSVTNRKVAVDRIISDSDTFQVTKNKDFIPVTVETVEVWKDVMMAECERLCRKNAKCHAFTINTGKICKLYDDLAITSGVLLDSNGTRVGFIKQ